MTSKMIGTGLAALREKKGLTQVALAKKARITQPYIAQIESGQRTNPSLVILQRLAAALAVPITKLLSSQKAHR